MKIIQVKATRAAANFVSASVDMRRTKISKAGFRRHGKGQSRMREIRQEQNHRREAGNSSRRQEQD